MNASGPVSELSPTQSTLVSDKVLNFALAYLGGETWMDLSKMDAIVSGDKAIMDGHHSTNEQVLQTIKDGEAAGMNRSHFGPNVVLIDMPIEYHRILSSPQNSIDVIPASQVLGYVDRQTMEFRPNSHYDPSKMQKPEIRNVTRGRGGSSSANHAQIPVPAPSASGASYDVF